METHIHKHRSHKHQKLLEAHWAACSRSGDVNEMTLQTRSGDVELGRWGGFGSEQGWFWSQRTFGSHVRAADPACVPRWPPGCVKDHPDRTGPPRRGGLTRKHCADRCHGDSSFPGFFYHWQRKDVAPVWWASDVFLTVLHHLVHPSGKLPSRRAPPAVGCGCRHRQAERWRHVSAGRLPSPLLPFSSSTCCFHASTRKNPGPISPDALFFLSFWYLSDGFCWICLTKVRFLPDFGVSWDQPSGSTQAWPGSEQPGLPVWAVWWRCDNCPVSVHAHVQALFCGLDRSKTPSDTKRFRVEEKDAKEREIQSRSDQACEFRESEGKREGIECEEAGREAGKEKREVYLNTLKLLLKRGADPNTSRTPAPVLFSAILACDREGIRRLLLLGARTDIPLPPKAGDQLCTLSKIWFGCWSHSSYFLCRVKACIPCTWLQRCRVRQVPKSPRCCSTRSRTQMHGRTTRTRPLTWIRFDAGWSLQNLNLVLNKTTTVKVKSKCLQVYMKAQWGRDESTELKEGGRTALHVACQRAGDHQVSTPTSHAFSSFLNKTKITHQ